MPQRWVRVGTRQDEGGFTLGEGATFESDFPPLLPATYRRADAVYVAELGGAGKDLGWPLARSVEQRRRARGPRSRLPDMRAYSRAAFETPISEGNGVA